MKTLLAAATFAALLMSTVSASAQVRDRWWNDPAFEAFAQSPQSPAARGAIRRGTMDGRVHSDNPAYDAYDTSGTYVGSDPDPRIRRLLERDGIGRD